MFHVPEPARDTTHPLLGTPRGAGNYGAFDLASPEPGWRLALIASDGDGWEHVSVHAYRCHAGHKTLKLRTPSWKEMCWIKRAFWDGDDVVLQFHPREVEYVNLHPHTLHLWRPIGVSCPTPPAELVGPLGEADGRRAS